MKCCLCGKEIEVDAVTGYGEGNNARPLKNGRCCGKCNAEKVIPARLDDYAHEGYDRIRDEVAANIGKGIGIGGDEDE